MRKSKGKSAKQQSNRTNAHTDAGPASPPPNSTKAPAAKPHSRYPLSPGEEERLRDEIVQRLLAMRCRMPERCAKAACRRANQCVERGKLGEGAAR